MILPSFDDSRIRVEPVSQNEPPIPEPALGAQPFDPHGEGASSPFEARKGGTTWLTGTRSRIYLTTH